MYGKFVIGTFCSFDFFLSASIIGYGKSSIWKEDAGIDSAAAALLLLPSCGSEAFPSSIAPSSAFSPERIYESNVSASYALDVEDAAGFLDGSDIFLAFEDHLSLEDSVLSLIPEERRGSDFVSVMAEIENHYEKTGDYLFFVTQDLWGSVNLGRGFVFDDGILTCYTYYDCHVATDLYTSVDVVAVSREEISDLSQVTIERIAHSLCAS